MTPLRKLWRLLTAAQRKSAIGLMGLMLIGMVLETLGIGLVIPALALMTQSNVAIKYPMLAQLLNALGNPGREQLVIGGMSTLVFVYAIKALFLGFLVSRQMEFSYGMQADLSQRLFSRYMHQPYTFHLQRNSAQLIQNVVNEIYTLTQTGLVAGLSLATEFLVLLGISSLLLTVEPFGALVVVTVVGLATWGIVHLQRKHILNWGKASLLHAGLRMQHLQEGLGSVKDAKLLGREDYFLARYQHHNKGMARYGKRQGTLQQLPRLALELLAVTGLATLVIMMIIQGKSMDALIPTLGLFAAAAFRFLPSANRVIYGLNSVRYALPVIDTLHSELELLDEAGPQVRDKALRLQQALTIEDVSFSYDSTESKAIHRISLRIQSGSSVGVIGSSGAGKSTLVDVLLGLLTPQRGVVRVDGVDIHDNLRGWQDQIGYVPQFIYLTDDTLRRNVAFGISDDQIDEASVLRAIRAAQLENFVENLPDGLATRVGERGVRLSGGQRQRIGIARALYHEPSVLVLDEATSSLDTVTEKEVMDAVNALHGYKTIIIVSHRLTTVERCDWLYRLTQGQLVDQGKPKALLGLSASTAS